MTSLARFTAEVDAIEAVGLAATDPYLVWRQMDAAWGAYHRAGQYTPWEPYVSQAADRLYRRQAELCPCRRATVQPRPAPLTWV